jgi:hypothetical protein
MIRYKLHHNLSARFMRPANQGDLVIEGYEGTIEANPNDRTKTAPCDAVFARHNRDDRPDGRTAPSLSVGDLVTITDTDGAGRWIVTTWTVRPTGWEMFNLDLVNIHIGPWSEYASGLLDEYERMEGER